MPHLLSAQKAKLWTNSKSSASRLGETNFHLENEANLKLKVLFDLKIFHKQQIASSVVVCYKIAVESKFSHRMRKTTTIGCNSFSGSVFLSSIQSQSLLSTKSLGQIFSFCLLAR